MKHGIYAILLSLLIFVSCAGSGTDTSTDDDPNNEGARFGTARFNETHYN